MYMTTKRISAPFDLMSELESDDDEPKKQTITRTTTTVAPPTPPKPAPKPTLTKTTTTVAPKAVSKPIATPTGNGLFSKSHSRTALGASPLPLMGIEGAR